MHACITREEILAILGMSAPREKAFYAIMAQPCLRPTTLCNLRLKNLEQNFSSGKVPCLVTVPEEIAKGKYHSYITFIGEDAVRLLRDYLNTRRNLNAESYVFTNQGSDEPMIYNTVSSLFRKAVRLLREKGMMDYEQKKVDRPAEIRLYTLRKWFRKMAIQAGFENVDFWMGHTGPGVDASYRPTDPEFYCKIYAEKAMPFLRLETTTPTEVERTIEEQAEQIKLLRAELDSERKKRMKLQEELLQKIEKMDESLKKMKHTSTQRRIFDWLHGHERPLGLTANLLLCLPVLSASTSDFHERVLIQEGSFAISRKCVGGGRFSATLRSACAVPKCTIRFHR